MAVTDAVDKNLRPLINKLVFSGCSGDEALREYAAHYAKEAGRHRQIVVMRLVAELYNGRWGLLMEEYAKALFLMGSGMEMSRRCRFLCLCLLLRGHGISAGAAWRRCLGLPEACSQTRLRRMSCHSCEIYGNYGLWGRYACRPCKKRGRRGGEVPEILH